MRLQPQINNEIWKDIYFIQDSVVYDYRGLYQVSNLGNVRSLERVINGRWGRTRRKSIMLKPKKDRDGYFNVTLCKNGKLKTFKLHRLVGYIFVSNPNNSPEINHINENKNCNEYWNLEWCTKPYNVKYSNSKKVNQYDLEGNHIRTWNSTKDIERELKFKSCCISSCCNGKQKTSYGYYWKYYSN